MDIVFGHQNIGLYLGVISMHFRVFFRSRYRMRNVFLATKISNIFGVLEIPDIFWGVSGRCLA